MGLSVCDKFIKVFGTVIICVDIVLGILGCIDMKEEVIVKGNNTDGEPLTEHVCEMQYTISTVFIVFFSFGGAFNLYQFILYVREWRKDEESHRGFPVVFTIFAYITASVMSICVILFKRNCKCQGVDVTFSTSQASKEVARGLLRFVVASVFDLIKCCKATEGLCKLCWKNGHKNRCITAAHWLSFLFFLACFIAEFVHLFGGCAM